MQTGFPSTPRTSSSKTSLGCLYAFLIPFFAFGLFFLGTGLHNIQQGKTKDGLVVAGFAILFMTFAGVFLFFGIRSHRKNKARLKFEAENPGTPWLWRPEWRAGRIRSHDAISATLLWVMSIAFLALSLPAVLAIPGEWNKSNKRILIVLVLPLTGVGLGVAAARETIRLRKFGQSELELHTVPGVIGGTLSGALEIPHKVRAETGFRLRLVCLRRTRSVSGRSQSPQEEVLWEDEKTVLRESQETDRDKTGLPVFFNIPFDQPESMDGNPAVFWRLEVSAKVPGVDYAAQFVVPVFKTAESCADAPPARDPTASFQPPPEDSRPPAGTRIKVSETMHGETQIDFPAARHLGVLPGFLAFLAIWTAAIWFMIDKKAPLLLLIVFGLVELLLIVATLRMLLLSVRLVASPSQIEIRRRFLLVAWKRVVSASDVESIEPKPGMQVGTKVYYALRLRTRAGKKFNVGDGVPDKRHAEWLVARLKQALAMTA